MPYLPTYDSRDPRYKTPYGAAASGTQVQFTLRPPRAESYSHASLTARFEGRHDETVIMKMPWQGHELGQDIFSAELDTAGYIGLVWYSFRLEKLDGRSQELGPYQLTVYDGTEEVPGWFGQGVTYQIFPDRFARSRIPDPEGLVGGRWVHQSWEEFPEYRPNDRGEVRNRDFFGGDFQGVLEKLDYLQSLGVETLYFNPIFEAAENHRYGTADYSRVDPMLGTNEDFTRLCDEAHRRGMRVMLDGVFNHTGYVSRYFNGDGFYPETGAKQSQDSPYRSWFNFTQWPNKYDSWWGIYSLPAVNENDPGYRDFIFGGEDSVVRRWLRAGADGWRLDVADELPDWFIEKIRAVMDRDFPDAFLLGEVWEDASTKVAYSRRRRYLLGRELHGVMNYPFRTSLLEYLRQERAEQFQDAMETLRENYPPAAFYSAMNFLSTHDTPRVLTVLGADVLLESREARAGYRLSPGERDRGLRRLRLAALVLFTFPGAPTVFYGDEAGMEGFEDPFNRGAYPWGGEDRALLGWFQTLGRLRRDREALRTGCLRWLHAAGPLLAFARETEAEGLATVVNASLEEQRLTLPWPGGPAEDLLTGRRFAPAEGALELTLPPLTGLLLAEGSEA